MTNRKQIYKVIISKIIDGDVRFVIADVDGYVYNDIGVRQTPGKKHWTATHLPSGHKICSAPTRRDCYFTARAIICKVDKAILQQATDEFLRLIKAEKERIQNEQGN